MDESIKLSRRNVGLNASERISAQRNGDDVNSAVSSNVSYVYESRDGAQGLQLLDYWRIVRKHLWLIIGISLLIPTLVAIILIRKPDIYEAQARIQVDLENANPLLGGMSKNSSVILNSETNDPAYFNTQLQILTGPGLLRNVAKSLDLEHNSDF